MISYRDMTFCKAKCANTSCPRMLTDKVKIDAWKWWGSANAPIAVGGLSEGCKYYEPIEETK